MKLTIFSKFCVNEQLPSWPMFSMIKTPNQIGLNMNFVLLYPIFKKVPRLEYLDHYGSRYGHCKFGISNSFNCPNTWKISKCSKSGFPSMFMAVLRDVRDSISRCFQHENYSVKSPLSIGSKNTSIGWPQLKIPSSKVMTLNY